MSSKVLYFRCTEFAVTMPVSDCKMRRESEAKRNNQFSRYHLDEPKHDGIRNQLMTKKCQRCTAWQELTKPENLITHEQMMQHMRDNPSQEPDVRNSSTHHNYRTLNTPHVFTRPGFRWTW